ncbi:hypothetical protein ACET3Z_000777 [Daucus carota]
MMCKSLANRQADFLTRSLFLDEKYGESITVLDGRVQEASGENVILPRSYIVSQRRFVDDSTTSLSNHEVLRAEQFIEMLEVFEKYQAIWKQNIKELKERAEGIDKQRIRLRGKLMDFYNHVFSDEEEEDSH